jgi:uncharacterized protein involved in type VI secretion and phage assembly
MINGMVVGLVVDNKDPDKKGKIKIKFPVDNEQAPESTWIRLSSPMAGKSRGLVMLPDVGTEVLVGYSHKTLSPYIVGGLYNGAEDPPSYANDDGNDDHRRFWSRNSHWLDFDDTAGAERIELISTSENEAIYQELHSANKVITTKVKKDFVVEAKETVSFKCKDFELNADTNIDISASTNGVFEAGGNGEWKSSAMQTYKGAMVDINGGSPGSPDSPKATPTHKHPPAK